MDQFPLLVLSEVNFTQDGQYAVVYYDYLAGHASHGVSCYLRRSARGWTIIGRREL